MPRAPLEHVLRRVSELSLTHRIVVHCFKIRSQISEYQGPSMETPSKCSTSGVSGVSGGGSGSSGCGGGGGIGIGGVGSGVGWQMEW